MNEPDDSWKDAIRAKLVQVYGSESLTPNPTGLIQLFLLLDIADMECLRTQPETVSPFWRTLRIAFTQRDFSVFTHYANKLIEDAGKFERDPQYLQIITGIYAQMADPNNTEFKEEFSLAEEISKGHLEDKKGALVGIGMGFARAWDVMTPTTRAEVVQVIKSIGSSYKAVSCIDECVTVINKTGGTVAMVALSAVFLTYNCYKNICRWYNGETSGKRCAKICIDSFIEVGAGSYGGVVGAAMGSAAIFPVVGTLVGGIFGGLLAGAVAKLFIERITMFIFDLPKEEALEKAYKFLGVHHKASNDAINRSFRQKALQFHPDKGGNVQDFYQLQMQMALIKISRGEVV